MLHGKNCELFSEKFILGRMVLFLAVLFSFFVTGAWAACNEYTGGQTGCAECNCNMGIVVCEGGATKVNGWCGGGSYCAFCPTGDRCTGSTTPGCGNWWYLTNCKVCSDVCEADSLRCLLDGGQWVDDPSAECGKSCGGQCPDPGAQEQCISQGGVWAPYPDCECTQQCDAQCQCDSSGGTWNENGYCIPNCESKYCCDSLNQNLPVETDTSWLGCVAEDPENDRCVVYQDKTSPGDTAVAAECNGKSEYEICTKQYVWGSGKNDDGQQCVALPSFNCSRYTKTDSNCSKVMCIAYQEHSIGALDYNKSTGCYEGQESVINMLACDNGLRQERNSYTQPFKVCDSYLDSIGSNIQDYLTHKGPGGGGPGGGGGSPGGGSSSDPYAGGESTDNEGNVVQNSASPNLGQYSTPQPNVVTEYDSTTGNTVVVKNSQGGDSVAVTSVYYNLKCLGYSNGVATLTNGKDTWTCTDVLGCSQAIISAKINGGKCSAGNNNINPNWDNSDYSDLPVITGDTSLNLQGEYKDLENAMGMLAAVLNGNHVDKKRQDSLNHASSMRKADSISRTRDSLWRLTFGSDLDAVRNLETYIASASSANSNAIAQASSVNSQAISSAASKISTAVGNASADIVGAVGTMRNTLRDTIHNTNILIETSISASSRGFSQMASAIGSATSTYMDSVRHTNELLKDIAWGLDTGSYLNTGMHMLDESILSLPQSIDSMYKLSMDDIWNDKIKVTMDSNAQKIVDAVDSLQLEVKLDSIKIDVPHDTILDSINDNLKSLTAVFEPNAVFDPRVSSDTLNFASMYRQGWDSTYSDTSLVTDSSLGNEIKSYRWLNGSDYTDSGFVDSVESTLDGKLDSLGQVYNARSDSMTAAYADTMMKYGGLDSAGRALNEFFASGNQSCDCFDISLTYTAMGNDYKTDIKFSQYLCELQLFGGMTAIDLIKAVLRIMTSIFCVFLLIRAIGQRDKK